MDTCAPHPAAAFQAEANLRALIESTGDPIWSVDLNYRLVTFNEAIQGHMLRSFGVRVAVGMLPEDLMPPERAALWPPLFQRALSEGRFRAEYSLADGRILEVAFNPIVQGDETTGISVFGKDITERKAAENELRESREKYQALIETMRDFVWEMDSHGRYTYCGPQMESLWGLKPEAMIGKTPFDVMPAEVRKNATESFSELARSPRPFSELESASYDGRGRLIQIEISGVPFFDDHGKLIGFRGTTRDITERKRAEELLRRSEERFQLSMEATSDGLWDWDIRTDETYFSPGYYRLLGYEPGDFPCQAESWRNLIHPDDREHALRVNTDCIEGRRESIKVEFRMKARRGEWRWILDRGKCVARDAQGRALRLVGTHVDITARKRAEDEMQEREARLREAQRLAHVGSSTWDVDSDTTTWSEEMYRITGWDPNRPAPSYDERAALYTPESWTRMREAMQRAMATGEPYELDVDIVRPDGAVRRVHASGAAVRNESGRVVRLHGTLQDITDQKRTEEALQQTNRKLQRISRDLLRAQDYERRRIARELHDSTAQLLAALSINLGRLRDSELEPVRRERVLSETIDLAAACSTEIRTITYLLHPPLLEEIGLVHALRAYAQGFNQRTGIQVKIKIPPDFGRIGSERESTLFRIIQEGLANVHKHSGSRLAVIELGRDPREVRLVLQDQGRGLTEAPRRRATGFVHLGVGITGMRERAEQLGGRLEIASGDAGTTLTVTLPMVQSDEETADIVGG
jgi:PAS domain S-box-containing protein